MILDSSALVAILLDEPEQAEFTGKVDASAEVGVGAPTLVETGLVLASRLGEPPQARISRYLTATDIVVIGFGQDHWRVALDAWWRFGRGRHPARLNLGDCLAYATARVARRPLLAKGEDFGQTDIQLA